MLSNTIASTPEAISGSVNSPGEAEFRTTKAPKKNTMIRGDSNTIFTSGARVNERKVVTATTEACSETQGNLISRNAFAGCVEECIEGAIASFGKIAATFFDFLVFPDP